MFTGLTTDIGEVVGVVAGDSRASLEISCSYPVASIAIGASIACAGACLTVVRVTERSGKTIFGVDVGAETLVRTTARYWRPTTRLNLERSLKVGDELGGHLVTGHVDGIATISERRDFDGLAQFELTVPSSLTQFLAEKGAVCLNGNSLTINAVEGDRLQVLLIPHTLKVTTWAQAKVGDCVNLEVDLMARYAAQLMAAR
jgi:riboflavin synthase